MKKFFIFLLVLVVVIGAVYFLKQKNSSTPTNPSIELDDRTYTDPKYNFSFSYPENLEINLLEDQIILSKKSFNKSDSRVNIQILKSSEEIEIQSFEEFVLDMSRVACGKETAEIIRTCLRIDDVVKISPFKSDSGVSGQVFYLKGEEVNKLTGKTSTIRRGPIYTFNNSLNTPNRMSFILISNPFDKTVEEGDKNLIEKVAKTFTILRNSQ